jgi:hypothetical protein
MKRSVPGIVFERKLNLARHVKQLCRMGEKPLAARTTAGAKPERGSALVAQGKKLFRRLQSPLAGRRGQAGICDGPIHL